MISQKAIKEKQSSIHYTVKHGNNELLGTRQISSLLYLYNKCLHRQTWIHRRIRVFSYFHPNISVVSFIRTLPQEVNRHLPPISHELTSSFECCFLKKVLQFFYQYFDVKIYNISEGLIDIVICVSCLILIFATSIF
jgi:hypothetical protein